MNISSYVLANAYFALAPVNNAPATCTINGRDCGTGLFIFFGLILVSLFVILPAAGAWKVYVKAGFAERRTLAPFLYVNDLAKIIRKPLWWVVVMFFMPFIGWFMLMRELSKSFGKGSGFAIGLVFLPFIFFAILGFGNSKYIFPPVNSSQVI